MEGGNKNILTRTDKKILLATQRIQGEGGRGNNMNLSRRGNVLLELYDEYLE